MLKTANPWSRAMFWLEHGEWAAAEGEDLIVFVVKPGFYMNKSLGALI